MQFEVNLNLIVEADDADEAHDLGMSMCEHLVDTFNDDDSISPLVRVDVAPVKAAR